MTNANPDSLDPKTAEFVKNLVEWWDKWLENEPLGDSKEWQYLAEASKTRPFEAFRLICAVTQRDDNGSTFHCLSDCIIDLLRNHGDAVIALLEAEASTNQSFAVMLSLVHPRRIPAQFRERVAKIAVHEDDETED